MKIGFDNARLYNWNYVDQLLCGYYTQLFDNLLYWRVAYILVPLEREKKDIQTIMEDFKKFQERVSLVSETLGGKNQFKFEVAIQETDNVHRQSFIGKLYNFHVSILNIQ